MRTRRRFTDEFKREAIRLVGRPGVTVSSVARDLDINVSVLRRWVEKHNGGQWQVESGKPLKTDVVAELERVRRELAKVKMERDILKKPQLLREGPDVRYGFIVSNRTVWPTRAMCRVMEVSHSGFYEWLGRAPSGRKREKLRLTGRIRESFEASDRTYGSPRVWRDLHESGEVCSENPRRSSDTGGGIEGAPQAATRPDGRWSASRTSYRHQRTGATVRGRRAEPEMGCRFHLSLDGGRLVVRGGGNGFVFAAYRRLVDGRCVRLRGTVLPSEAPPFDARLP